MANGLTLEEVTGFNTPAQADPVVFTLQYIKTAITAASVKTAISVSPVSGDVCTAYEDESNGESAQESAETTFELTNIGGGFGMSITEDGFVVSTVPGSPAAEASVPFCENQSIRIVKINGEQVSNKSEISDQIDRSLSDSPREPPESPRAALRKRLRLSMVLEEAGVAAEHRELLLDWLPAVARGATLSATATFAWPPNAEETGGARDVVAGDLLLDAGAAVEVLSHR
jgi:hypothetical protein